MPKHSKPRRRSSQPRAGAPRYQHPVPDANALLALLADCAQPVTEEQLASDLGLRSRSQRAALSTRLAALTDAGGIKRLRGGTYRLSAAPECVTGIVSSGRDGSGSMRCDDGSPDIWISPGEMHQLLDGDHAALRVAGTGPRGQRAGSVVEILARGTRSIVGRLERQGGLAFVVEPGKPARRYVVADEGSHPVRPGYYVALEITAFPTLEREAEGRIVRVLGDPARNPAVATDSAIEMFALPAEFPHAVSRAAAAWGPSVRAGDAAGRLDLRDMPLVTIDGTDARDFDDAVYAEPRGKGWRLVVAIADVSHYVRPGDPLDVEAGRRGTSVYFPDRVVPMLPEQLSNGLCSLNPHVDRLCMVCDMDVDADGEVTSSTFHRAVMRSRQRLVYEDVQAARDGDRAAQRRIADVRDPVERLYGVYEALGRARERRGALDLELPETKVELGEDGHIARIGQRHRNDAHRLIEECMIAANVEAARFLRRHRLPTLYRVHDAPVEEKFETLRLMLQSLGVKVTDAARTRTREFNAILRQLRERPDYPLLATSVLRSLAQAVYQPGNIGHFGLALGCYAHFTSPIRRYPDLLVHRGIGHVLDHGRPGDFSYAADRMTDLGRRSSEQERRADEATRFAMARYKCAYVKDRVGQEFSGIITGVTGFGLFVMLDDIGVDGLVHISTLGRDYFNLQPGGLRLKGERTGRTFALGDRLEVRIVRVDVDEARVDLELAGERADREPRRHGRTPRRKP